jgi:hypothetical protein
MLQEEEQTASDLAATGEKQYASHYSAKGREADFQPFPCQKWRRSLPATTPPQVEKQTSRRSFATG